VNWYKRSQLIETFEERNILNARIRHLEEVSEVLRYAADLIYQTQRGARGVVQRIMADKRLSSFPDIKQVLAEADKIALDSPVRFSKYVLLGADEVSRRVLKLKSERKKATDKGLPRKGLL
jgi:hypothetical protein